MKVKLTFLTSSALLVICIYHVTSEGQYDWMKPDQYDYLDKWFHSVKGWNCRSKSKSYMKFPNDTVSQLPVYNQLLSRVWYRNRTTLIHIHNMALNRAFFFSYILQKMNDSATFDIQPNWQYYYYSAVADVNANPNMVNGSSFMFDNHCHYPNWYTTVPFNKTLPLFGPKAFRWDDTKDQDNYLREPTKQVVKMMDLGAGRLTNYTHPDYKMNPWYDKWMPDIKGDMDSLVKFTYYIGIKKSNATGVFTTQEFENYAFFGPNSPSATETDQRQLPVFFTPPYFDCGVSNKWIVSAVSPVIDFMPRYSNFTHLRRQRVVGVITMDTDFNKLDFNACGVSPGNPGPSYLSGIARCRPTTGCKHVIGKGFKRHAYVCVCKAGKQYPWYQEQPYQGSDVEQSTKTEYMNGFQCTDTDYRLVLPVIDRVPGEVVVGLGGKGNGGSLDKGPSVGRKRRDVTGCTTNNTSGAECVTPPDQPEVKVRTPQEMMRLADKIREFLDRRDPDKPWRMRMKNATRRDLEDIYTQRNSVPLQVEKLYESDLKEHRQMRRVIEQHHQVHLNASRTVMLFQREVRKFRNKHISRFQKHRTGAQGKPLNRHRRASVYDPVAFDRMMRILRQKENVNENNCAQQPTHMLQLPGDVGYGNWVQFKPEGQTAVRLTNFLSLYLQNVWAGESYGNLRGGKRLQEDQLIGEVLANVMGNHRIYSAGLYFDRYKFENNDGTRRQFFGPWAFSKKGAFYVLDRAGLSSYYTDEDWFRQAKSRYSTNFEGLKTFKIRPYVRSNPQGTSSLRHEYFPVIYRAAPYEIGYWTRPHFRCDGMSEATWVMTYVSPFFGLDSRRQKLEFRGVATVDVPLNMLEINQCPQPFTTANAFKNTARCDYFSTKCVPQAGFPFMRGSYRCLCRLGFDYWHQDGKFWFEGSLVELEYEKKQLGRFSRFDHLTCRVAKSSSFHPSTVLIASLLIIVYLHQSKTR